MSAGKKWIALISGSSRGFGRSVAEELVRGVCQQQTPSPGGGAPDRLHVVLIARSREGLESTAQAVESIGREAPSLSLFTQLEALDLSNLDTLEEGLDGIYDRVAAQSPLSSFDRAVFINNAGSLGTLTEVSRLPSLRAVREAIDFNVTSSCWLTADFARRLREASSAAAGAPRTVHTVVNVSSLAAIQPFSTWGLYCAGKAARDLFHATLAKEEGKELSEGASARTRSCFKVLNYSPGAMDTDMQRQIRTDDNVDPNLRSAFQNMKDNTPPAGAAGTVVGRTGKVLITPAESARKCVRLLLEDDYETGAHIDFHDKLW